MTTTAVFAAVVEDADQGARLQQTSCRARKDEASKGMRLKLQQAERARAEEVK